MPAITTEQQHFVLSGHRYEVHLHPPMEGFVIIQGLASLGLEPLAQAIEGALPPLAKVAQDSATQLTVLRKAAKGGGKDVSLLDVDVDLGSSLEAVLSGLKLGEVGGKLARAFQQLDPQLVTRLLAYTNRDGKELIHNGEHTLAFNAAYRGNYVELMLALVEVARRNGFFGGWATSIDVEQLWATAKGAYQRARSDSSSEQPAEE